MRKEIIFAIILGIILGGVIIYGIKFTNQATSTTGDIPEVTTTPTPPFPPASSLKIISPQNHAVLFISEVTIQGTTLPNAHLAIIWEEDEAIIESDQLGNFSLPIELVGGENKITINAVNQDGLNQTKTLTVIYTTAEIK